jgi:hypothetical protein
VAPTLVGDQLVSVDTSYSSASCVSSSFTPSVGEVIVVFATTENESVTIGSVTSSSGLTFTLRLDINVSGASPMRIWTAIVDSAHAVAQTITVPFSGGGSTSYSYHSMWYQRWGAATIAATPAISSATKQSTPNISLTTARNDSIIAWVSCDYNGVTPPTTITYRGAGTTEIHRDYKSSHYVVDCCTQPAAVAGAYTVGATNPTSQLSTVAAIEIQSGTQTIAHHGLPSANAFGKAVVIHDDKTLSHHGIPSAAAIGHGTVTTGPVTLLHSGLGPKPGEPDAFGIATILMGFMTRPTGIPSALSFGHATVTPGPVTLQGKGIASKEAFGRHKVVRVVTAVPSALIPKEGTAAVYELVCVARVPQQNGPPTFIEIDPLQFDGLAYTQTLNKPSQLNVGVQVSSLTEPIVQRLRNLSTQGTELWLYRNGRLVFAGPWITGQIQNQSLTINAKSLEAYFDMMVVVADLTFKQIDQFMIGKQLIDQWQGLTFGHFGIDTSVISNSGVLRDATYLKTELNYVSKLLFNLSQLQNGFDYWIDPTTRELNMVYPLRGVDRSSGEGAIVFDERNVTNTNLLVSVAPQDVASDAYGTGTSTGGTNGGIYSSAFNAQLQATYGRSAIVQNFDGVSVQATLDSYTKALVDARDDVLWVPGPDALVTPDSDLSMYDIGDTVSYTLHEQLGISGAYRIRQRQVKVEASGKETVTPQFA